MQTEASRQIRDSCHFLLKHYFVSNTRHIKWTDLASSKRPAQCQEARAHCGADVTPGTLSSSQRDTPSPLNTRQPPPPPAAPGPASHFLVLREWSRAGRVPPGLACLAQPILQVGSCRGGVRMSSRVPLHPRTCVRRPGSLRGAQQTGPGHRAPPGRWRCLLRAPPRPPPASQPQGAEVSAEFPLEDEPAFAGPRNYQVLRSSSFASLKGRKRNSCPGGSRHPWGPVTVGRLGGSAEGTRALTQT